MECDLNKATREVKNSSDYDVTYLYDNYTTLKSLDNLSGEQQ